MRAHAASCLLLLLRSLIALFLCGCGTPGVPQPPSLNLAKPVSDLKATRIGDQINLTWTVPNQTTDGATFRHRGETKLCRAIDQPKIDRCTAVLTLHTPTKEKSETATTTVPSDVPGPKDYATFAVAVENDRGRSAGLSNRVQVPTAAVSTLNGTPTAQLTADAVIITTNITSQNGAVLQVLELRRQEKGNPQETTVARRVLELPTPGEATNIELRDDNLAWEKTYDYRVALVGSAKVPNGDTVSFDAATSPLLEIVAHDVFPPAVPTEVQAVFSGPIGGQQPAIDLTWTPDTDRDLAGYFVYRRLKQEPSSAVVRLNQQPIAAPAYHDTSIQLGNTYVYSVSAVDERGNESKRSEETSEAAPKS
jgi:hypothetical protein